MSDNEPTTISPVKKVFQFTKMQLVLSVLVLTISVGMSVSKGAASMLDARYDHRIDSKIAAQLADDTIAFVTKAEIESERNLDQERWNDVQLRLARIEGALDRLTAYLLEHGALPSDPPPGKK